MTMSPYLLDLEVKLRDTEDAKAIMLGWVVRWHNNLVRAEALGTEPPQLYRLLEMLRDYDLLTTEEFIREYSSSLSGGHR